MLAEFDYSTIELRVLNLIHVRIRSHASGVERYIPRSLPLKDPRDVEGSVAHAYDRDAITKIICIRICKIVYGEVAVAKALSLDAELLWSPYARSDEDCLVSITEEILYLKGSSFRCIWPYLYDGFHKLSLIACKECLWKAEVGYSILEDASYLIL